MPALNGSDGWIYNKINPSRLHFPYLLDSEHANVFDGNELYIPDRLEKQKYKDTKNMKNYTIMDVLEPLTGVRATDVLEYHKSYELWKEAMNGPWTVWGPNKVIKKLAFEPTDPGQLRNDRICLPNEYTYNPLFAEVIPEAPSYFESMHSPVNITVATNYKLSKIFIDSRL
jgi:hypothetical protein